MRALLRVLFYSILLFLHFLLIPEADIISFEFFSIQLKASIAYFLLYSSITSFLLNLCYHSLLLLFTHLLFHTLEVLVKYSSFLPIHSLYFELFLII